MKHLFPLVILFFLSTFLFAQEETLSPKKQTNATFTSSTIKIDGLLDEADWYNTPIAKDFIQLEPDPGKSPNDRSEVRVLYDNTAIYIGAKLYDASPDSILRELSQRDEFRGRNTDWFGLTIDPYQDGLNGVGFFVSASGVQMDVKYAATDGSNGRGGVFQGDRNWDAVWNSAVSTDGEGWIVELKIPYSAIRFPDDETQLWNVNFGRLQRRSRQESWWNEIKPDVNGFLIQAGQLAGIKNIKSPVRLSATPFVAYYLENNFDSEATPKSSWNRAFNGGMDVKYGINDAFTLDMTLIPDFGQVQSDNQVLNLSPFEVQFDENRQFFTEGIELFNKGNLFYSRRIGGTPLKAFDVEDELVDGEEIVINPSSAQLYNATKVSGRNSNGLGIGVFNAVSRREVAIARNEAGEEREIETSPLTNYNVLVFDQNLKNNSYVTLLNTNVWRNGADYDANVLGTDFLFNNKNNTYFFRGGAAYSDKFYTNGNEPGHRYGFQVGKGSGNFTTFLGYNERSDTFDPNDLGFLTRNNLRNVELNMNYSIFKPFWKLNRVSNNVNIFYSRIYRPDSFSDFAINYNGFALAKTFFAAGIFSRLEPIVTYDFFEPRTDDFSRSYAYPTNFMIGGFVSSDYRKKVAFDAELWVRNFNEEGRRYFGGSFEPRFRASDKLFFIMEIESINLLNDVGYVNIDDSSEGYTNLGADDIIFSIRDQNILENVLNVSYTFNNKMGLTFRARHYWTKVDYNSFHLLDEKGALQSTPYKGFDIAGNSLHNTTANIFNIDMVYRWRFAPGSDLFFVWKNAIFNVDDTIEVTYFNELRDLLREPQTNSLSVKFIYYLDYLSLRSKKG